MSASPQQMVHSGFNVSVPTQGALMSHAGSVHQMSPVYATSQPSSSHASASHMNSSPAAPTTCVTTSSQWPVANDGAWYPDTGATHHVTNDSANLQAGTVYTAKEFEASVKEYGLPLVVSSPLVISSQQRDSNVSQQPMVADLGDDDSECHPADHMQDQTMQDIDTREVSQELYSHAALDGTEPQQQNFVSSQQSQRVRVDTDRTAVHVKHTDVDIQNVDIDIQRDSVQPSPVHSGNGIHEELFPEDAQVTDGVVTEILQGDNAMVLDGFQTNNAMEPDGNFAPMEPDAQPSEEWDETSFERFQGLTFKTPA
ncbi:hypothetical protein V6N11_049812 [Hibiscus sabdariffa]|uniref:Uncharacterized protein n=1 Tax=Hibiscus sabdariffa TaxID=183260 RepID=A0ABR2T800_9ROSI